MQRSDVNTVNENLRTESDYYDPNCHNSHSLVCRIISLLSMATALFFLGILLVKYIAVYFLIFIDIVILSVLDFVIRRRIFA